MCYITLKTKESEENVFLTPWSSTYKQIRHTIRYHEDEHQNTVKKMHLKIYSDETLIISGVNDKETTNFDSTSMRQVI